MTSISVDFDEFQINVETQEQWPAGTGITWRGAYNGATAYVVNDSVSYLGSSYICILASTNNLPTNVTYWSLMASKWDNWTANITTSTVTDISWLLKGASWFIAQAIADTDYLTPTTASTTYVAKNVAITGATKTKITYDAKWLVTSGADATTADIADSTDKRYLSDTQKTEATRNASGSQNGLLSSTDWTTFNSKQDSLGFTPENVANKENTTLDTSATKYPTNRLVKEYADSLVVWLLDYRGGYDASVNTFPTTWGSWTAWAVIKGDMWVLSVAWTLWGSAVQVGDSIIANTDTPGQTAGNWNILNSNISYVPEDQANKETSALDTSVTKYPCNNVVKSAIEARYAILEDKTSDYTANSTNSWKMWMRSDEASSTVKWIVKTESIVYATWNPADKNANITLSNGNLTATWPWSIWYSARATIWKSSWKWYWEVQQVTNTQFCFWVGNTSQPLDTYCGSTNNWWTFFSNTTSSWERYHWWTNSIYWPLFENTDIAGIALDMDNWEITIYKNGVSQWIMYSGLSGTLYPMISAGNGIIANFWASAFTYSPPIWYNAWLYEVWVAAYTTEQFPTKTYTDSLISDTAYDATSWNWVTTIAPSKNAIRDKIEALDTAKVNANVAITWATKTKITYDAKWLVTSWTDATTADIVDSTDKRYVTDANLIVIGNTSGTNTGDNTNHATFSNIAWTSSWHTGSNLWAPLFDGTWVATQVVPTAWQSIRINAGGTAWEAYTPGSGLSWWASVNWATWTGVALAMDNSYASGGIGQSIIVGNTQTNALIWFKADMWTSAPAHVWFFANIPSSSTTSAWYVASDVTTITSKWCFFEARRWSGTHWGVWLRVWQSDSAWSTFSKFIALDAIWNSNTWDATSQIISSTIVHNFAHTNRSTDPFSFSWKSVTDWSTKTHNFNMFYIGRQSQSKTSGTHTAQWSVLKLENTYNQTAGTLTDSVTPLSLVQANESTWWHILFNSYSGSPTTDWVFWFDGTNFKARVGWATKTFTIT